MRIFRLTAVIVLAACLFAPTLRATTYIVPTDQQMIGSAQAIVSGTVIDRYCRRASDGSIETVTEVKIDERLKGASDESTLKIVQWGGHLDDQWMVQSDAPEFTRGERVLLFVHRNAAGEWTTWSIGLGAFRFHLDPRDVAVLERFSIVGWAQDGQPHIERPRLETAFLEYIRSVVRGEKPRPEYYAPDEANPMNTIHRPVQVNDTFTGSSYSSTFADVFARRRDSMLNVVWRPIGTQPGLDLTGAVDFGDTQWNNQSPKITYTRGSTATANIKDVFDSEERVIANDPNGDISGTFPSTSVVATAFSGCSGAECDYFTFNGETFLPFTGSDIVVNDGVSSSNVSAAVFNVAMAHEIGHTVGLRHSNQLQSNTGTCAAPLECCINTPAGGNCKAVMLSSVTSLAGLQQWDKNAIDCLYDAVCDGGAVSYDPPTSVVATAASGTSVNITWTAPAGGTTPDQYDVYRSTDGTTFTQIDEVLHPTTSYTDLTASANTAYLYKVRSAASGGTNESSDSNKDFATTVVFTDPTITAQSTIVKAAHVTELRTAVNAMRTLNGGQGAFSFTDATLDSSIAVKAVHFTELQTQLNTVRTALGFSTVSFTETPSASDPIEKLHVDELRPGIQ